MCLKMIRPVGRAGHPGGVDELPFAQGEELGADQPGQPGPQEQAQCTSATVSTPLAPEREAGDGGDQDAAG